MPKILQSDLDQLRILRARRKSRRFKYVGSGMHPGVYINEKEYDEMQAEFCSGCGSKKVDPAKWFGEEFCGRCVWLFKNGERP